MSTVNEKTNGDSPAFAKAAFYHPEGGVDSPQKGLTKREHFAAMAMQGLLSNPKNINFERDFFASDAVYVADALINALNNE